MLAVVLAGGAYAAHVVIQAAADMPSLTDPLHQLGQTSVIYDRSGHVVTAVPTSQNRQVVPLSDIPLIVQHAFVAAEDRRFYQNEGFDLRGILRAAVNDLTGHPLQGGSTITQQLAKNIYLTPTDTLTRKVKEAWLAIELYRRYTKAEILDRYLNWIYLGEGAYGVDAASEAYFGVPIHRVTLPEAALIAGLTPAPSAYDPIVHPNAALTRRNTVLQLMFQQHYITRSQEKAAVASPLGLSPKKTAITPASYPYPWFVDAVINQLEHVYHLTPQQVADGGLRIYTTLSPKIEAAAQRAVNAMTRDGPAFSLKAKHVMQVAETVINPANGNVVAIIGGRQHTTMMAYDRALFSERQPGSSIKPLVDYIPALLDGMTAGTTVDDVVHTFHPGHGAPAYTPQNYDHLYYGLTTFDEALRRSVNVAAVKVLNRVGVRKGMDNAIRMGLPLTASDDHLALALGGTTNCCTTLDMARAYAAIANGGYRVHPRFVTKVVGPNGRVLVNDPVRLTRVIPANVAYVMTKMLETVDEPQPNVGWDVLSGPLDSNWGTGYDATVHDNVPGWPTAAKTGTSNSNKDAWYVGFTPKYAAAVWVGYDHPRAFPNLFGDTYAGPVFKATLEAAVAGLKPVHFPRPPGIVQAPIDIRAPEWTVALPGPLTPRADIREEWFVAGTQPTQPNPLWVKDKVTASKPHLLWQPSCGGTPLTRVYLNRKPYTAKWAQAMAKTIGVSNWQSLIPVDMSLAPPAKGCAQTQPAGTAQAPPQSPSPSGTSQAPPVGCTTLQGGAAEICQMVLARGSAPVPSAILAQVGEHLTLSVTNTGGPAQLRIPSYGVDIPVGRGGRAEITLTPGRAGTFEILDVTNLGTNLSTLVIAPAATASPASGPTATPFGFGTAPAGLRGAVSGSPAP